MRGTAITGLRFSQPTYSASGATCWSTGCRSAQAAEYLLCTIRSTTFVANTPGSACGCFAAPQPGSEDRAPEDDSGESGHAFSIRSSPGSTETASVSGGEPVRVAVEQLLVGDPELDAVGDLEAGLLAQHVHLVDEVEEARLQQELVVERGVERDGDAVLAGDGPALAADPLDEHLVRLEHVAVDLEAAAVELLELAALQPLAHVAQGRRRASARAPAGSASRAAPTPRPRRTRRP